MDWQQDRELSIRIGFTLGLLGVVTILLISSIYGGLVASIWLITCLLNPPLSPEPQNAPFSILGIIAWLHDPLTSPMPQIDVFGTITWFIPWIFDPSIYHKPVTEEMMIAGLIGTVLIVGYILLVEFSGELPAMRGLTARSATKTEYRDLQRTEYQDLQKTVERLTQQAGLPVPTVLIEDTTLANAYTSGLSPQRATIILTMGLLDQLDAPERQAVLAHELVHIKNRDGAVMTIASVPLVIAQTINEWADEQGAKEANDSDPWVEVVLSPVCFVVAGVLWVLGRLLIRSLSRYRELAADRGAIALTGSPAMLASALETIDAQIGSLPDDDLRSVNELIKEFMIVPVETDELNGPLRLGADDDRHPYLSMYIPPLRKRVEPWLATHPSMETRLKQLRAIERQL